MAAVALAAPRHAAAQQDTSATHPDSTRVSYRTEELVFLAAGREAGLAVGDTVDIVGGGGAVVARAVVTSVARQTASATLISGRAAVAVGQKVRFAAHPVMQPQVATAPPPDTSAGADTSRPEPVMPQRSMVRRARWRGSLNVDQSSNASGGAGAITSYQTTGTLSASGPLAPWLSISTRTTTRYRNGSAELAAFGLTGSSTVLYELKAKVAPVDGWWNFSLGRFVPTDAPSLGYLDGACFEVDPARGARVGFLAGYQPDVFDMSPSTNVAQAGGYLGFSSNALSGSLSAATQWEFSQIRRTWFTAQTFWIPANGWSVSLLTDVDRGAGWEDFRGLRLTNLSAGLHLPLPFGFRGGVVYESHASLRLYSMFLAGDTLPLPGRLSGVTADLGKDLWGSSVEVTGGYLQRVGDPNPTYRGSFMLFNRHFMIAATGQHGDLFDFGSLVLRLPIPLGLSPFTAALGMSSNVIRTPGGAQTLWRYGVQPEFGWRLGAGWYLSANADIGKYAGLTNTYLRAGVSYQLW